MTDHIETDDIVTDDVETDGIVTDDTATDGTRDASSDQGLTERLDRLQAEVDRLRSEVARLDADLDESRRLNLRAAELLDVVYERLALKPEPDTQANP